jgi:hypothetical protein
MYLLQQRVLRTVVDVNKKNARIVIFLRRPATPRRSEAQRSVCSVMYQMGSGSVRTSNCRLVCAVR